MAKKANFKTTFSIDKMTIAQADELYRKLLDVLSFDLKDRLSIQIEDCVGGKHNLFEETGITPDCRICNKCKRIDCADCPKWKTMEKDNEEANHTED